MNDEDRTIVIKALDILAISLTDTGHTWLDQEVDMYNLAMKKLRSTLTSRDFTPTVSLVR